MYNKMQSIQKNKYQPKTVVKKLITEKNYILNLENRYMYINIYIFKVITILRLILSTNDI